MKLKNTFFAFAAIALSSTIAQAEVELPKATERAANISTALIPSGFDNREPVAILGGLFPNSCYSWVRADVKQKDTFTHEVQAIARVQSGMCLMVMIPYSQEVELGEFAPGQHTVRFLNGDGTYIEKSIEVR